MYKEDGKIKIKTDNKYFVYVCTGVIPYLPYEFLDQCEIEFKMNSGIHKNSYKELFEPPYNVIFIDEMVNNSQLNFEEDIDINVLREKFYKLFKENYKLVDEKLKISNIKESFKIDLNNLEYLNIGTYKFINITNYDDGSNTVGILCLEEIKNDNYVGDTEDMTDIDNSYDSDSTVNYTAPIPFKKKLEIYEEILMSNHVHQLVKEINFTTKKISFKNGSHIRFDKIYTF